MAENPERKARLTKRFVDGLPPADVDVFWWDTDLRGFAVRVWPSGQKTFLLRYRNREGRARKLTLGRYGPLTVDQAREMARARLGEVAQGGDPAEQRATHRASMNVSQLCGTYQTAMRKGLVLGRKGEPKKASTIYVDEGRIKRHILPLLGHRKANEVTLADISRFRDAVAEGKTAVDVKTGSRGRAIVEGGKGTATRALGLLGAIFQFGVRQGIIEQNPVRGVEKFAYRKKKALLTPDQYRVLGSALDKIAGEAEHNAGAVACTRLIALTGLRLSEAQTLRWTEVDFEGRAIRLGDSKTGVSIRPLSQDAANLLRSIPRQGAYVFPAAKGKSGHTQSVPKFWRETLLPKASEIARESNTENLDGLDRHALRHSLAGTAEGLGLTVPTIAALLGHSLAGVTEGYVLKRLDAALIASADRVSALIQSMMSGQESAFVVPLHRTAS